ncbi:3-demethylubiquinone-9 3-methyltransferase [Acetobacter musti]|uniref:3-demethylubiquinone-9 3-methyltransferase n=1 Tax=Acetobacter musti TaxID=864732 RepID=A0ABX0JMI9_9PROT|nr:3-demethylubiquinone-9 3-methyltransferase [Acetobacter musti]NHN84596.1 3-demethylubiquinone-9 3-methyltransferase [Acetobacter musti]
MTSRKVLNTRLLITALLSATALIGLGGAGWVWMHRKADDELTAQLTQLRSQLPPGTEFTWRRAVAMPVSHGARLMDVTLKQPMGTITAAALELVGAHQKAAAADHPGRPLLQFDHVLAHTLHVNVASGDVDIRRLALDGLTLPGDSSQTAALAIDHGELAGLSAHAPQMQITLTAGSATLDQYGIGRPSRLVVQQFALKGDAHPARTVAADRFSLDGSDLASRILGRLHGEAVPERDGTENIRLDKFSLSGVVGNPGSPVVPIFGIERLTSFSNISDQKSQLAVSLTHFRIWPSGPQLQILQTLGYSRFDSSVVLTGLMDRSAGAMHVSQFDLNAPGFGRLDLSGDLVNVPGSTEDVLTGSTPPPNVTHLDITWRDGGLVGRILKNSAIAQGVDPDAYVPLLQRSFAPPGTPPDSVGAQLGNYIVSPDSGPLIATIAPPQPMPLPAVISLLSMATRQGFAGVIGLTLRAPGAAAGTPGPAPDPDMTTDEPVDPDILKAPPPNQPLPGASPAQPSAPAPDKPSAAPVPAPVPTPAPSQAPGPSHP